MSIITIVLFFLYLWGFGFTASRFVQSAENFLERNLMRLGIGLGIFPILAIILNFFHIPLDWRIFLLLSMGWPAFILSKRITRIKIPKLSIKRSDIYIIAVLALFIITFFVYARGAFIYPYLENQDPWGHTVGAKYVAIEKNAYDPSIQDEPGKIKSVLAYIEPYPPAYDVLMGVLHQTTESINWTMKFFNALLISLGIVFFYFFAKQLIGDRNKALFSTFVFAMLPCYLSHFIWAHALVITIFFPLMYALERMKVDKRWKFIAAAIFASVWVSQNLSQPLKLSILILIYFIAGSIVYKKLQKEVVFAAAAGFLLSLFWWGAMIFRHGFASFMADYGASVENGSAVSSIGIIPRIGNILANLFNPGGSASRPYLFHDFFVAKPTNMINNPIGIGIFVSIIALVGVAYVLYKQRSSLVQPKNFWLCLTMLWLIYTFLGVNGETFNIYIARGAFRVWMLLAIPVALICSEGIEFLYRYRDRLYVWIGLLVALIMSMNYADDVGGEFPLKGMFYTVSLIIVFINIAIQSINTFGKNRLKISRFSMLSVVFIFFTGILLTSGYQKYSVNTAIWPTEGSFSGGLPSEPFEYAQWFNSLPTGTKVFLYTPKDNIPIGLDAFSCYWCPDIIRFREDILSRNVTELYSFLKRKDYQYFVLGRMDYRYLAVDNETTRLLNQRTNEILSSGLFRPVHQVENVMIALRVL